MRCRTVSRCAFRFLMKTFGARTLGEDTETATVPTRPRRREESCVEHLSSAGSIAFSLFHWSLSELQPNTSSPRVVPILRERKAQTEFVSWLKCATARSAELAAADEDPRHSLWVGLSQKVRMVYETWPRRKAEGEAPKVHTGVPCPVPHTKRRCRAETPERKPVSRRRVPVSVAKPTRKSHYTTASEQAKIELAAPGYIDLNDHSETGGPCFAIYEPRHTFATHD